MRKSDDPVKITIEIKAASVPNRASKKKKFPTITNPKNKAPRGNQWTDHQTWKEKPRELPIALC